MRLLTGAERGDGGGHRLGIVALVDGIHGALVLHPVELGREGVGALAQLAAHGVPEVDLGAILGLGGNGDDADSRGCRENSDGHMSLL
jgi:hypothetical protein